MPFNSKRTSDAIAELAAETMKDPNASKTAKQLAGSALSQVDQKKQTGPEMESIAAKVLESDKYSDNTKKLAGAVLTQANKERHS